MYTLNSYLSMCQYSLQNIVVPLSVATLNIDNPPVTKNLYPYSYYMYLWNALFSYRVNALQNTYSVYPVAYDDGHLWLVPQGWMEPRIKIIKYNTIFHAGYTRGYEKILAMQIHALQIRRSRSHNCPIVPFSFTISQSAVVIINWVKNYQCHKSATHDGLVYEKFQNVYILKENKCIRKAQTLPHWTLSWQCWTRNLGCHSNYCHHLRLYQILHQDRAETMAWSPLYRGCSWVPLLLESHLYYSLDLHHLSSGPLYQGWHIPVAIW